MILASIEEAKRRGATPDQILAQIAKQNPKKATVIQQAQQRGATGDVILKEVEVQNYLKGLAKMESGGKYTALGPKTANGKRAYGKYQVMEQYVPSWTKQHLGRAYTPDEFLNDQAAQDKLARARAEADYAKHGNWADVASVWFSGRPMSKAGNASDITGTTVPDYVKKVVGYIPQNKTEVSKRETYGATFPSAPGYNPTEVLKAVGNVPSSFFNMGKNLVSAIANPIKTGKAIFNTAEAVGNRFAENTVGRLISGIPGQNETNERMRSPQSEEVFAGLSEVLKQRYFDPSKSFDDNLENLKQNVVNDPAGFGSDILSVLGGGAALAGKTEALNKGISATAKLVTKPVSVVTSKVASGISKTTKFGVSQATGLEPSTINTITSQPSAFSKGAQAATNRSSLGQQVKSAINTKIDDLSDLGSAYQPIRESGAIVKLPKGFLDQQLAKHGLTVNNKGRVVANTKSITRNTGDLNAVQNIVDNWRGKNILQSDEFLNLREDLAQLAKYDAAKTSASATIARDVRGALNEQGRPQLTGLQKLDSEYSTQVTQLKQIKKDYLVKGTGEFQDGAASKIANLTGKGKDQVLGRLEEIMPGVTKKINVLKAVEDIERASGLKVATYTRSGAVLSAGAFGLATGNPVPVIVAAILQTPEIAVPLIRGYGLTKQAVAPVLIGLRKEIGALNSFTASPVISNYVEKRKTTPAQ